jgi:hypothetical protein
VAVRYNHGLSTVVSFMTKPITVYRYYRRLGGVKQPRFQTKGSFVKDDHSLVPSTRLSGSLQSVRFASNINVTYKPLQTGTMLPMLHKLRYHNADQAACSTQSSCSTRHVSLSMLRAPFEQPLTLHPVGDARHLTIKKRIEQVTARPKGVDSTRSPLCSARQT